MARWKRYADWAKYRPLALRLADRLGRSRGRLAVLNHVNPPAPAPCKPELSRWSDHDLAAAWLGHATVLLRIGGMTVLTDPVLSNRVGVGLGLVTGGPKRLVAPALSVRELPPIDLILISHAHYDHLDRPTLARLPSASLWSRRRTRATCSPTWGSETLHELGAARVDRPGRRPRHRPRGAALGRRTFLRQPPGF